MNSLESGLFTNNFETAYNIKKQKPGEILKLIYTHLVDVTEPSSLGYNIEPYMICISQNNNNNILLSSIQQPTHTRRYSKNIIVNRKYK